MLKITHAIVGNLSSIEIRHSGIWAALSVRMKSQELCDNTGLQLLCRHEPADFPHFAPSHEPTPSPLPRGEPATGASNEAPLLGGAGGGFMVRTHGLETVEASRELAFGARTALSARFQAGVWELADKTFRARRNA
jgi:hypothetical protein